MRENYSPKFIRFVSAAAPKIKPYSSKDKDGKDIYVYDAKLIPVIAKYFRVRYEILTPPDGEYGRRLPGGNWTGMIGMVQRDEADLAMSGLTMTEERFSTVNYSYPYIFSSVSFMTDAPQPMPTNLAIFYPFSNTLWIILVGLTIAMSVLFYVLLNRRQSYQSVLLSTVGSILEKAIVFEMTNPAVQMAASCWILGMFVLINCYKAVLLSFLSFPTMIGIRDISELSRASAAGSFTCITFPGTYLTQDLAQSEDPTWKAIGECLIRNEMPGDPLENFLSAPQGKAYIGAKFLTVPYERRYSVSEDDFFIEYYGIPFSKKFCCAEDLNRVIHRFYAAGIFDKISREVSFWNILQNPSLRPEYLDSFRVMKFEDMSGAFYVLTSGWMAGFIALLIEILVQKLNKWLRLRMWSSLSVQSVINLIQK